MVKNLEHLAGVVIIYNPPYEVYINILSYISNLDRLYIYDNSPEKIIDLNQFTPFINKIDYIFNNENKGIAECLNMATDKARSDGFDFLFTLDQDSCATDGMIDKIRGYLYSVDLSRIGIISPFHVYKNSINPIRKLDVSFVEFVPTSGNLINLSVNKLIGNFRDDFFIDYVDVEYCLRLRKNGFGILQINTALLNHNLGELETKKILLWNISITNHNHLRLYYRTRNRFVVIKEYYRVFPGFCLKIFKMMVGDIIKIIIYESHKLKKINYMMKGSYHFLINKMGKLEY